MNKLKFLELTTLLISMFCIRVSAQQNEISTISPDKNLIISVRLKDVAEKKDMLVYSVDYKGKPVVLESELGLTGTLKCTENFSIKEVRTSSKDSIWHPIYGERNSYTNRYNESVIVLNQSGKVGVLEFVVRAYNEGIAFRYFFPEKPTGGTYLRITNESTGFTFSEGTKAWVTGSAQGAYSLKPLKEWPTECERPLTLELENGLYASLAEAEMVDYSRTKFSLDANKTNTVKCAMYEGVDLFTPFATPWRVIMVAEKPGQLVENNFILLNLNPPCKITNTDWIKPGKIMRETTLSAKGSKELIDFAVKHHIKYIHFDAGWYGYEYVVGSDATKVSVDPRRNRNSDLNLQVVIRYAKEKGIGVFLYVNQRALANQLDDILPLYQKWGVAGIKFGFVEVGSHRWTTWLHEAVKKCAKYNLMVDIHDEYRPTGFSRTYPNLLTQEGIRGNEEMPPATNSTVQPFTRFLAGPADHTICYYHQRGLKPGQNIPDTRYINTTSGHQLGLAVVFYSPLQFLYWYDKPSDVQDEPELEFFDQVPVVWDDTKVLVGKIGEYISVARRSGKEWFVGSVTNTDARTLKLSLDFLPAGKKFEASIYSDDETIKTPTKVGIKRMTVNSKTILDVDLKASGGQAIHIVAKQ
jgi:alpha-glucosidase